MNKNVILKLVGLVSILILTALGIALPIVLGKNLEGMKRELMLSLFNTFAAGVFISGGCMHLLVNSIEDFADSGVSAKTVNGSEYPLVFFLFGLGFLLVWFIGELTAVCARRMKSIKVENRESVNQTPKTETTDGNLAFPVPSESVDDVKSEKVENIEPLTPNPVTETMNGDLSSPADSDSIHDAHDFGFAAQSEGLVLPLIVTVSVCFHAFLAGLSLGVSGFEHGLAILIAILAHKGAEAVAVATSFVQHASSSKSSRIITIVCLTIFLIATPIGITLGIILTSHFEANMSFDAVKSCIQALAAGDPCFVTMNYDADMKCVGSFLFIGTLEMGEKSTASKLSRITALLAGFFLMAVIAIWA